MACSFLLPVYPNDHQKSDTFDRICAVDTFLFVEGGPWKCVMCSHADSDGLNLFRSQTWTPATEEGCSIWLREEPASSSATLKTT